MDAESPTHSADLDEQQVVAVLEHLTGPCRDTATWLSQPSANLWLSRQGFIHLYSADSAKSEGDPVARLHRAENSYVIEAIEGRPLWVNGQRVSSRLLANHDTIEFGENGPMSRYNLYDGSHRMREGIGDIFADSAAYFRASRRPVVERFTGSSTQMVRRLVGRTTIPFRIGVIIALIVLGGIAYQQSRLNALLQQQIASGAIELENFSRTLARSREEALSQQDLEALSEELRGQIATAGERIAEIERRSEATEAVIAQSVASIPFLQGAYGFREKDGERMLRHVLGEDGKPLILPNGLPSLSIDGDGPVAERQFTGTGFAIGEEGILVTNRHVGEPWAFDANINVLISKGLEPTMTRFIAYFPGRPDGLPVELIGSSGEADIALLRYSGENAPRGLTLAEGAPDPGEEVIVMGYPTGLRSMLAQAGENFVNDLRRSGDVGFWTIASRLSAAGRIMPLASRGIVAQATEETIVFDADTTHGGSGGPVLNTDGSVVAVTAAILPEYGGSNLGVPITMVVKLLEEVGSDAM